MKVVYVITMEVDTDNWLPGFAANPKTLCRTGETITNMTVHINESADEVLEAAKI